LTKSTAACTSCHTGPFPSAPNKPRPLSLLGERRKRYLAYSVAGPWQWGRGLWHGQICLNLYAQAARRKEAMLPLRRSC
jgi:hypothetical protein